MSTTGTLHAADAVRFEGFSVGTEIWGMTQANFLVQVPGRHAKEAAVMFNDAAARMVAEVIAQPNSEELRERAAVAAGSAWFERAVATGAGIDSAVQVSEGFLHEHPWVLDAIKRALAE